MDEQSKREQRKNEHVDLALKTNHFQHSDFDHILLIHQSLPELGIGEIDLATEIGPLKMSTPFYINAMTGGSKRTGTINGLLSEAAKETNIAIAVGSQHSGIRNETLADTYKIVRKNNPNGLVFANVGADVPTDFAFKAIDMLEADALQIHVNVPQELVMPEGERGFGGLLQKIETIISKLSIPVIIKETGFGMSSDTLKQLRNSGIQYVDLGGKGGTNFIDIENERREKRDYSYLNDWGLSTPISLYEAQIVMDDMTIMASGGIRNPLDVAKCLALGASAAGVAGSFLKILHSEGVKGLIEEINEWKEHLKVIYLMQGVRSVTELQQSPVVATRNVLEWCENRGIDYKRLAKRRSM